MGEVGVCIEWSVSETYLYHKEVLWNQMHKHMYLVLCRLDLGYIQTCMLLK